MISCNHCSDAMMRDSVVIAKYANVLFDDRIGRYAEPVGDGKIIHRHCFDDVIGRNPVYDPYTDNFVTNPVFDVGSEPSPRACACCNSRFELGDVVWSITYCELTITPRKGVVLSETAPDDEDTDYPDTYICTSCGDIYVFGE